MRCRDLDEIHRDILNNNLGEVKHKLEDIIRDYFCECRKNDGCYIFDNDNTKALFISAIAEFKNKWPNEQSEYELLAFNAGDRIYGLTKSELPVIMVLGKLFGEGQLIIDYVNDSYREQKLPSALSTQYGASGLKWLSENNNDAIVLAYYQHYQRTPKLKDMYRRPVTGADPQPSEINRACKAGILHTIMQGGTIHFNLDDLDLIAAVDKHDKGSKPTEGFFTFKELRYIYRLFLVEPGYLQKIKFYENGKATVPPWTKNPEIWAKYNPKLQEDGIKGAIKASL